MTELTEKEQRARARICLALDVPTVPSGIALATELSDLVSIFKINNLHHLAAREEKDIIAEIVNQGGDVFLDLKYHDTPQTVYNYARDSTVLGVCMFNIHISGGETMCKKAIEGAYNEAVVKNLSRPKVIGVTELTSLNDEDLAIQGLGIKYDDLVLRRTELARKWGLDGVVCPANKAGELERRFGSDNFVYVTPGIEWEGNKGEGQKQLYTPDLAVRDCKNSILVVGSAITKAKDKRATAYDILKSMAREL